MTETTTMSLCDGRPFYVVRYFSRIHGTWISTKKFRTLDRARRVAAQFNRELPRCGATVQPAGQGGDP